MARGVVNVLGVIVGYTIFYKKPFSLYLRLSSRVDVKDGFPSPRNKLNFAFKGT